ncbi:hypothetical protein ACKKBG_A03330 [Auxenochlorella protothecoides x Auxenochlorella symbiontica]
MQAFLGRTLEVAGSRASSGASIRLAGRGHQFHDPHLRHQVPRGASSSAALGHQKWQCSMGRAPGKPRTSLQGKIQAGLKSEASKPAQPTKDALGTFLSWALQNGVSGIGSKESKVALFEGQDVDSRGLVAVKDVKAGEILLRVPARLAITDADKDGPPPPYPGAPWSLTLASRLLSLREGAAGSAWEPYLEVLPRNAPSPWLDVTWEALQIVQYPPARAELDRLGWIVHEGIAAARAQGASWSTADFHWALGLVHSRTFGSAGKRGGVGVRMLVPLVDMINHAGDETPESWSPGAEPVSRDNARWDMVPQLGGRWTVAVSATQDIAAGSELLLSYGERNNDDFLLHYGFVPPMNPHDDVVLFEDVTEALQWCAAEFQAPDASLDEATAVLVWEEAAAAATEVAGSVDPGILLRMPAVEAGAAAREAGRLRLQAQASVDARFLAVVETLHARGWRPCPPDQGVASLEAALQVALARRCRELAGAFDSGLCQDLERLAAMQAAEGGEHPWAAALRHYRALEARAGARWGGKPTADPGVGARDTQPEDTSWSTKRTGLLVLQYQAYKKMILWDGLYCDVTA